MNAEVISLILTLLSNIQVSNTPATEKIHGIYASWESTASVTYRCPDPSSGINPMGENLIVSASRSVCDETGCSSVAAVMPVTFYPNDLTCEKAYRIEHHKIFESMASAGEFKLDLPGESNWSARDATDEEVVKWALDLRGWKITHYPGGDAYSYPDGVYEVYRAAERNFTGDPLGQGKSAAAAVADALEKNRGPRT